MSKCDTCIFKRGYTTGMDEYPANTYQEYCAKGHWEGNDEPEPSTPITHWDKCPDFIESIKSVK